MAAFQFFFLCLLLLPPPGDINFFYLSFIDYTTGGGMDDMDNNTRRIAGRERTRSESGKENSTRPVTRQRRSERRCDDDTAPDSPIDVTDSALPSDSDQNHWGDQHSSEEELECINGGPELQLQDLQTNQSLASSGTALRFGPSAFGRPDTCQQHNSRQVNNKTPLQVFNSIQLSIKKIIKLNFELKRDRRKGNGAK